MFYDLKDKKPKNSGENWVAPNATIIGDVTLEKNSSIWFNAVLRGDIENIHIVRIEQLYPFPYNTLINFWVRPTVDRQY